MNRTSKTALAALLGSTALAAIPAAFAQPADEIVVRGARIPDEKRATSEISSVIDEESFQRTGDSDIAAALARVSGLSVSDGKFVIVRGLNERYSSVTINGSPLPSPEPLRRVVPLDLIPTSFLSGSLVQKTYSPEFSAEFGGGLVELRTKSVPDEFYLTLGVSAGLDTVTTAKDGLFVDGGGLDFLGFDEETRELPDSVRNAFFGTNGVTPLSDTVLLTAFDNPETATIFGQSTPPNYSASLAAGGFKDITGDIRFGANFAMNFGNDFQTRRGRREQGLTNTAVGADQAAIGGDFTDLFENATLFDFESTTQTTTLNGLSSFGLEIGDDHEITATTFILRSSLKDSRISQGRDGFEETAEEILFENSEYSERQAWQTQLGGEHFFPEFYDLSVTWRGAYGRAYRDAPFQRETGRFRTSVNEPFTFSAGSSATPSIRTLSTITFSEVRDKNIDAGADFVLPLTLAERAVDVKAGYAYTDKSRDTSVREFVFTESGIPAFPDPLLFASTRVLFSEPVTSSGVINGDFQTAENNLDNANSSLLVHAAYIGLDAEINDYLRLAAGGRFEDAEINTDAFATVNGTAGLIETTVGGDNTFFLPSATLTWNPVGDLQVRFGYSKTITRPQFRELTPTIFLDDDTDQRIIGNPFLVTSRVTNYDVRAEYYFGRGQFVTLGGFYKDITNPIETSSAAIGPITGQTFLNAPSAELYGFEFEYEQTLPLIDYIDNAWFATKDLVVKTNYTFTQSEVSADGTINRAVLAAGNLVEFEDPASSFIIDGRSLQGQSDHLFNLQLGLEDAETNSKATFLVNFASKRIRQTENLSFAGPDDPTPAVIEQPPVLLDFVWSRDLDTFGADWEINFAVRNILGDEYRATQDFPDGSVALFDVYDLGREISIGLKRRF